MRITINLATRPFADLGPILKRLRIAMIVFAVVSIGLGIGLHLLHTRPKLPAPATQRSMDNQIGHINRERQGYEAMMRQPDNAQVLNRPAILNQLFDQKAFSWTLAMEDLETVLPGGVQVTTLEPIRDKEGRITLRLRVVGPRDKATSSWYRTSNTPRHFLHPTIVGESSENNGGPGETLEPVSETNKVNFDLLAEYNAGQRSAEQPRSRSRRKDEDVPQRLPSRPRPAQHMLQPVRGTAGTPPPPYREGSRAASARPWPERFPASGCRSPVSGRDFVTPGAHRNPAVPQPAARPPSPTRRRTAMSDKQDHIVARTDGLSAHLARGRLQAFC